MSIKWAPILNVSLKRRLEVFSAFLFFVLIYFAEIFCSISFVAVVESFELKLCKKSFYRILTSDLRRNTWESSDYTLHNLLLYRSAISWNRKQRPRVSLKINEKSVMRFLSITFHLVSEIEFHGTCFSGIIWQATFRWKSWKLLICQQRKIIFSLFSLMELWGEDEKLRK